MTSDDLKVIRMGGITCLSDMGLYQNKGNSNWIKLLSLYGSPQEVRAVLSGIVSRKWIEVSGIGETGASYDEKFRFKTTLIGYGKRHGLLRSEDGEGSLILWLSPEEKIDALNLALSKRKIPFTPEFVPDIEKLLLRKGFLEELSGWGGISGYLCNWNDDKICDLIGEKILSRLRKRRKDGTKKVS